MELFSLSDMSFAQVPSYAGITPPPAWQHGLIASQGLVEQLQTTLDLQQQLQMVSMAAGKIVPLCGMSLQTGVGEFAAPGSVRGDYEYRSMLVLHEQCLGEVIYSSDQAISPLSQRRLMELESQWLFALRNALVVTRLQQLALRDTLTGLGNRRYFDEAFARSLQLAERKNQQVALVLLDLDNFKQVNDNFGHHAGDDVLLAVADAMRNTLRASDTLFRFGGDEFAVLLCGEDAQSVELVAHRLVKSISSHHQCEKFNVSASAGLACYRTADTDKTLFGRADAALYQAKLAGKNAVRKEETLSSKQAVG
ncbi:MAG TPA: GGDEF domain-containing protein [Rheinheimera sp.]|nr:GGDEF domain-containing protein [Rheinheimera sp.]